VESKNEKEMTTISFIFPVYNEEKGIVLFFKELSKELTNFPKNFSYQFICVDDGSSDDTFSLLKTIKKSNSNIEIIRFSRNFGKEMAIKAGFDYAKGDAVILMDCDLEDPIGLVLPMINKWQEGYDVVYTTRSSRNDTFVKRNTALAFYKVIKFLSKTPIFENSGDFRLFDKRVVNALLRLPERTRFSKGLFNWVGFRSTSISYERKVNKGRKTKWNYSKLWEYSLDGIISFSTIPVRIWTYIGFFCSFISLLYGGFIFFRVLTRGIDVPGYASLLIVMLFCNGLLLINLGVLGEYISRIFIEVKHRPLYIVDEHLKQEKEL
jgi:polyisoprenyl-phosphate glycosyltransferase